VTVSRQNGIIAPLLRRGGLGHLIKTAGGRATCGAANVEIALRDVRDSDLPTFWAQTSDERAQHMAAVTRGYHYDRAAFDAHWAKVRSDPAVIVRTVLADGEVAGHAAVFGPPDEREVT
jgi:hypothetical protein